MSSNDPLTPGGTQGDGGIIIITPPGGDIFLTVTGNSATFATGNVTFGGSVVVAVTGNSITASAGTLAVHAGDTTNVTGNLITSSAGNVTVSTNGNITVHATGNSITSAVGTVTVSTPTNSVTVNANGNVATFSTGTPTLNFSATATPSGNQINSAVGNVIVSISNVVNVAHPVSGVQIQSAVGSVTVQTSSIELHSVSPNSGTPGSTVALALFGVGFSNPGLTVNFDNPNITTVMISNITDSSFHATVRIQANANAVGNHNISVSTIAGISNSLPFTVKKKSRRLSAINIKRN